MSCSPMAGRSPRARTRTQTCSGRCGAAAVTSVSPPASSFSCTRLVTSWAARCSTSSTMPPRSWSATANSSPVRPNSSDASSAGRSPLPCRSSPRAGSGICSGPGHVLERPARGGREGTQATARRCRSQAEQVEVMPFPALQRAFDDLVPKGMQHSGKRTSLPNSPTRRSPPTSNMARGRRTCTRPCISTPSTARRSASAPTRPPSDTGTSALRR